MRRFLVIISVLIAALVIGFAVFEFNEARTAQAALAASDAKQEDLRSRLLAAEKRRNELMQEVAALRGAGERTPTAARVSTGTTQADANNQGRRGRGGDPNSPFGRGAMFNSPEMQRLMATQQKAQLDARYGALFKTLGLSSAQIDQFKDLLLDKQDVGRDVMDAARSQGLGGPNEREQIQALMQSTAAETDASIKALLGDAAYGQYEQYQQTLPMRNAVDQLANRLNYTADPLTAQQTEQMVAILAATAPPVSAAGGTGGADTPPSGGEGFGGRGGLRGGFGGGGAGTGPVATITPAAVTQAQSVLTATQLQALQQIQGEQQAQQQRRAAFQAQAAADGSPAGGQSGAAAGTPAAGATTGSTPARRPGG